MSVSLEEVAKRARVSTATVSRVLNNIDVVKSATRSRVMRVIEELNYQPDLNARTLAGGRSQTLGMIVSNLENPFFFDIYRALESLAHAAGYDVLIANTGYEPERLGRAVRLMIGRRVAGLGVIVSEMDPDLMRLLDKSKIPAVFYDVGAPARNISNIRLNYRRGVERIVEYLHDLGHRRLAFVGHHATLGPTIERENAFVETVARFGEGMQWRGAADQDGLEGGRRAVRQLLSTGFQPSAIICVNDFMALGVLRELRDRGFRVPGDISVTGFDNIQLSEYAHPPLTTVHIPRDRIGQLVFESLAPAVAEGPANGHEFLIDPELVLRESTGPVCSASNEAV